MKIAFVEGSQFAFDFIDVFRNPIGLDVGSPFDEVEFLVIRARRLLEGVLRHVERISLVTGNHEERLVDQVHIVCLIKGKEVEVAADRVLEGRVRMTMGLPIIDVAFAVKGRHLLQFFFRDILGFHARGAFDGRTLCFGGALLTRFKEPLLDRVTAAVQKAIAANLPIPHTNLTVLVSQDFFTVRIRREVA